MPGLRDPAPGKKVTVELTHADGSKERFEAQHSYNENLWGAVPQQEALVNGLLSDACCHRRREDRFSRGGEQTRALPRFLQGF